MTIDELRKSSEGCVSAEDISGIIGICPQCIRVQARRDASRLGFPVIISGRRVAIPREAFLKFITGGNSNV